MNVNCVLIDNIVWPHGSSENDTGLASGLFRFTDPWLSSTPTLLQAS